MCGSDPEIKLGKEADKIMKAFVANYPQMASAIRGEATPNALSEYEATAASDPLYKNLGAKTDLGLISGHGGTLANKAIDLDKSTNPEFYKTRTESSNALSDLFKSIDLSGSLSGGERAEIERANNRSNINSGINSPTPLTTIENAMNFGRASGDRKLQQQGVATAATSAASGFLPTSRTPIDTFKIATGRESMPTASSGLNTSAALGSGFNDSLSGLASGAMEANVSRRSAMEKFMGAMPSYSG